MRYSRTLSLAGAVAIAASLAACGTPDPYGPNNYPVSDINPNPGGVALAPGNPATGGYYAANGTTTYVTPGSTTTYVVPAGSTVVTQPGTYVAPGTTYVAPGTTVAAVPSVEYGRVTNVAVVNSGTRASRTNEGVSTLIGAGSGGAIGNTSGGGAGRIAATILGAFAGGAAGHALATRDYNNYAGPVYRVWVATDSGAMRTYDVTATNLRPGDRVRIDNGVIYMG